MILDLKLTISPFRTDKAVLAVNGFAADGNMFVQKVQQRLEWYHHAHNKEMPLRAIARLIQTMLYAKRFFPYYVYNILGGIEEDATFTTSPPFNFNSGAKTEHPWVFSFQRPDCVLFNTSELLDTFAHLWPSYPYLEPFPSPETSSTLIRFKFTSHIPDPITLLLNPGFDPSPRSSLVP
ncbi:Proteasome subunit beta type-6 [Serendipita sp. 400]|nr:Proteasome subunit beta type-6 [Serendipita sp. 400]